MRCTHQAAWLRTTAKGPGGWYKRDQVQKQCSELFVFGENDTHHGTSHRQRSTQAVIRGLPNAAGIRTCSAPGVGYRDEHYATNIAKIDADFAAIESKFIRGEFRGIVLPGDGLGTGQASLPSFAPKTNAYLLERLGACKGAIALSIAPWQQRKQALAQQPASATQHQQLLIMQQADPNYACSPPAKEPDVHLNRLMPPPPPRRPKGRLGTSGYPR